MQNRGIPGSRDSGEKGETDHEVFLEFMIKALFADHLTSKQEEAREWERLQHEIDDLKADIETLKSELEDREECP